MNCILDNFSTKNKKSFSNHIRWHKRLMNKKSFIGINKGYKNGQWRGDKVGINGLHKWVERNIKRIKKCVNCRSKNNLDLANISQRYKRRLSDFEYLCRSCHMYKDGRIFKLHKILKNRHDKLNSL